MFAHRNPYFGRACLDDRDACRCNELQLRDLTWNLLETNFETLLDELGDRHSAGSPDLLYLSCPLLAL